tara:strand:+ start:791 stop:1192 length:402 start_codon:yes stop_codon:yes gene_type:complete
MITEPKQAMPRDWDETDFARELMAFSDRKYKLDELKAEDEQHKKLLVDYCKTHRVKEFVIANQRFTCRKGTKRVFSDYVNREITRYEQKIKEMKEKAIENEEKGIESAVNCTTTVNEFKSMQRSPLGEKDSEF